MSDELYRRKPFRYVDEIPVFSQSSPFTDNYEEISRDHLEALREHGENPFIPESVWREMEESTFQLLQRYSRAQDRVLDVGVGLGRLLERLPDRRRYGIDISMSYLAQAKAKGIDVAYALVEDMPYRDSVFDVVVCTDVLEHVSDLNAALAQILRVLRPGGTLIARVPYREELGGYLDGPYQFIHLRSFEDYSLRLLLEKLYGCDHVETVHAVWLPGSGYARMAPRRLAHLVGLVGLWVLRGTSARAAQAWLRRVYRPLEMNQVFRKRDTAVSASAAGSAASIG